MRNLTSSFSELCRSPRSQRRRRPECSQPAVIESLETRRLLTHALDTPHALEIAEHDSGPGQQMAEVENLFPYEKTFQLSSLPGAQHTVFLDFDGHVTENTPWNKGWPDRVTTGPFSLDSATSFSSQELAWIQHVWNAVAEDFAPFEVNVTTAEPSTDQLSRTVNDDEWGIRIVIGDTSGVNWGWFGIAYMKSFNYSTDTPAFVSSDQLLQRRPAPNYIANTVSHETGHALGLYHHGYEKPDGSDGHYYPGHGTGLTAWTPLMGSGVNAVTQWSTGDFPNATSTQDDLAIITDGRNGFGYRQDDHGDSLLNATTLSASATNAFLASGLIETRDDHDAFAFDTTGGNVEVVVTPNQWAANLNVGMQILDASGNVLLESNPAESLGAGGSVDLGAGRYFVAVTGAAEPGVFSDYGSLGSYTVSIKADPDTYNPLPDGPVSLADSVLKIDGTPLRDKAIVKETFNGLIVEFNDRQYGPIARSAVSSIHFEGGDGNDRFVNRTDLPSVARGGRGRDRLVGGRGDDELFGENNHDRIRGRGGDDTLKGGAGSDRLFGGHGNDVLDGGPGRNDRLVGGKGFDITRNGTAMDNRRVHGGQKIELDFFSRSFNEQITFQQPLYGTISLQPSSDGETELVYNAPRGFAGREAVTWTLTTGEGEVISMVNTIEVVPARLEGGLLTISGTASHDIIQVTQTGSQVIASINGYAASFQGVSSIAIYGNDGHDTIVNSTSLPMAAHGGSGNDTLRGGSASDRLSGNDGIDQLFGGPGMDWLDGGSGNDHLRGGHGNDRLLGQAGNDTLEGGGDNDVLYGHSGQDTMYGHAGNDVMFGGDQSDLLDGGSGHDRLHGGQGNDRLFGQAGNDTLEGRNGNDHLEGGDGNDVLYGNAGHDFMFGQGGQDSMFGEHGDDTMHGGHGDDYLRGDQGADRMDGGYGNDHLKGADGNDYLQGSAGNDFLEGGAGNDHIRGGSGVDSLYGNGGNDLLRGGSHTDYMFGGRGDDRLFGDGGRDYLDGGHGNDLLDARSDHWWARRIRRFRGWIWG